MTVNDDDPLYQMLPTGLRKSGILPSSHPWLIKCHFTPEADYGQNITSLMDVNIDNIEAYESTT